VSSRGLMMLVLPLVVCLGLGCEPSGDGPRDVNVFEQLQQKTLTKRIAAASYPLLAMAKSIAGDEYEVWMPARADKIPTADEIRKLQSSDVLLTNGPGTAYATWLPMVTLDQEKIFETTTHSFELSDFIQVQEHQIVHSHGGEGEHSHFWVVPHCWLNPRLALLQGKEVCDQLCELYSEDADSFRGRYELLERSLQEAAAEAAACQKLLQNNKAFLLLSDPRLRHLGRAVESDVDSLLWFEPQEMPAAKQELQEMIAQKTMGQKSNRQRLLLWARTPSPNERELMAGQKWIQLDLIESAKPEKGFAKRVKDNFKLLADGIEMVSETDGGVE